MWGAENRHNIAKTLNIDIKYLNRLASREINISLRVYFLARDRDLIYGEIRFGT